MDGKRTGWQVCVDTADVIREFVDRELKQLGHLSIALVISLRRDARRDDEYHADRGFLDGRRAVQPKQPKVKKG